MASNPICETCNTNQVNKFFINLSNCNHIICQQCIVDSSSHGTTFNCPSCGEQATQSEVEDIIIIQELGQEDSTETGEAERNSHPSEELDDFLTNLAAVFDNLFSDNTGQLSSSISRFEIERNRNRSALSASELTITANSNEVSHEVNRNHYGNNIIESNAGSSNIGNSTNFNPNLNVNVVNFQMEFNLPSQDNPVSKDSNSKCCMVCNNSPENMVTVGFSNCSHFICQQCIVESAGQTISGDENNTDTVFNCPSCGIAATRIEADCDVFFLELSLLGQKAIELHFVEKPSEHLSDELSDEHELATSQSTFECEICWDIHPKEDLFKTDQCNHESLCNECAQKYLRSIIGNPQLDVYCPGMEGECNAIISLEKCKEVLTETEFAQFDKMLFRQGTLSFTMCPKCPNGVADVDEYMNGQFICPTCEYEMCTLCNRDWHDGECEKNPHWEPNVVGDDQLLAYALENNLKNCPHCHSGIERSEGCNHMPCTRSGTNFCFICGKIFKSGDWEGGEDHQCPQFSN